MQLVSRPVKRLHGRTQVPGDKSISHRAAMLGAVAEGVTEVEGFLNSLDCRATLSALEALGVKVAADWDGVAGRLRIEGAAGRFKAPAEVLDLGNSGTSLRLLSGLLCGQDFASELTGDKSLRRRPMRRVAEPLVRMGADVRTSADGTPPLEIHPVTQLRCIDYRLPVASAQIKSCLLFASLFAEGTTVLSGKISSRDHTERMLAAFGAPISVTSDEIRFAGGAALHAAKIEVAGDLSSAAFLLVAACLVGESELLLENVGVNPTRNGVLDILKLMGADIEIIDHRVRGGEDVASLRVRASRLRGITVPQHLIANAIDEFPVLFVAAACADGVTELSGAAELQFKESNRIKAMAEGLHSCGVSVSASSDGLVIEGGAIRGGRVNSYGDHRVAMSFAVAGGVSERGVTIDGCSNIDTSFPGFSATAGGVGFDLEWAA